MTCEATMQKKFLLDRNLTDEEADKARDEAQLNAGIEGELVSFEYDPTTGYGRTEYDTKKGKKK